MEILFGMITKDNLRAMRKIEDFSAVYNVPLYVLVSGYELLYQYAIKRNDPQLLLFTAYALLSYNKNHNESNNSKIFDLYCRASVLGDSEGKYNAAQCYRKRFGIEKIYC